MSWPNTHNVILEGSSTQRTNLGGTDIVDLLEAALAKCVLARSAHNAMLAAEANCTIVLSLVHLLHLVLLFGYGKIFINVCYSIKGLQK